jgi:hypothetical protein
MNYECRINSDALDNLVNYETWTGTDSSWHTIDVYSSADPNALSSHLKNSPLVEITFAITVEQVFYN